MAQIKEVKNLSDGRSCVQSIVDSLKIILEKEHAIMKLSAEMNDEGTNAILSQFISEHEKLLWMYSASLNL
jgi:starvation-inducible DNA-binding protein